MSKWPRLATDAAATAAVSSAPVAAAPRHKESKPVPIQEQAVHHKLVELRKQLTALKHGRTYVMKDVEDASKAVGDTLTELREVREGSFGAYDTERNPVDEGELRCRPAAASSALTRVPAPPTLITEPLIQSSTTSGSSSSSSGLDAPASKKYFTRSLPSSSASSASSNK